MFSRLDILVGCENRKKIEDKTVMIIGVGGVGGYTVEALVRCGLGNIIIVDYDKVDISNINRQIIALNSNIGKDKVDLFEERIHDINPNCNVIKLKLKVDSENIDFIDNYSIDYLIDCCDSMDAKKALISKSISNNIPLISSMGTGKRLDPSKLLITTLDKTNYDPIARILRKYVKDNHINKKIKVLTSLEQPKKLDTTTIGSCSFVPSSGGLLIASFVFNELIK